MNQDEFNKFLKEHLDLKPPRDTNGKPKPKKRYRKKSGDARWVLKPKISICSECNLTVVDQTCNIYYNYKDLQWVKKCRICQHILPITKASDK